jgi:ubiquinone/menaquinone biosynthesis C-methylase UbiE
MVEETERQRAALNLAVQYAENKHETAAFINFYENLDPKVYEDMSKITEFSDEQEAIAKAIYQTKAEGGLELPKDVTILDVACGTGMFGRLLHN